MELATKQKAGYSSWNVCFPLFNDKSLSALFCYLYDKLVLAACPKGSRIASVDKIWTHFDEWECLDIFRHLLYITADSRARDYTRARELHSMTGSPPSQVKPFETAGCHTSSRCTDPCVLLARVLIFNHFHLLCLCACRVKRMWQAEKISGAKRFTCVCVFVASCEWTRTVIGCFLMRVNISNRQLLVRKERRTND